MIHAPGGLSRQQNQSRCGRASRPQPAELGCGSVLYANVSLQGAVFGMQKALTALRDERVLLESSGLVADFAERQRLVGKPDLDALEHRYAGG
jgi:hypothetical protein